MTQVLMTKPFFNLYKRAGIDDEYFYETITEIQKGLTGDKLGNKIFKKRIRSNSRGKSGSFRSIYYYLKGKRIIYLYLYQKSLKENVSKKELKGLKLLCKDFDTLNDKSIRNSIKNGTLKPWNYEKHKKE